VGALEGDEISEAQGGSEGGLWSHRNQNLWTHQLQHPVNILIISLNT